MEMIMIEKRVYDSMVARIETLANKVATLNEQREKRMKHWLDSWKIQCKLPPKTKAILPPCAKIILPP